MYVSSSDSEFVFDVGELHTVERLASVTSFLIDAVEWGWSFINLPNTDIDEE